MSPGPALALAFFAAGAVATQTFGIVCLALAPFARVLVEKASFGIGPRVHTARIGATVIDIKAVPIFSSVTPFGANPGSRTGGSRTGADEPEPRPPPPNVPWLEASPLRRVLVFLVAPHLTTLALAAAVLGPTRAARAVVLGVVQLLSGAVGPFSIARGILDAGAAVWTREGFLALSALALCKAMSATLFALPTDLAFATAKQHRLGLAKARAVLMLVMLLVYAAWLVAWIGWIVR